MKISIITVVYNGVRFLEQTILSIINQTSKDYEFIIIDGGSDDGTLDVIRKFEKHISKWISESDSGLYDAMNKGLKMATGEYVWFINAGDEIFGQQTLGQLINRTTRTAPDILYGETMIIDEHGKEIGMRRKTAPEKLTWKSLKQGMVVCHQSFIPRRFIAPYFDLNYKYSSDIDWEIKCLKKARNIDNTKLILSRFLDGGQSKSTIIPSLKERFSIMVKNYGPVLSVVNHIPIVLRFFWFYLRNKRF
jgi:glycosyltransferase involved in cell wall biosynthesis